jgi:hypothetical protein
MSHLGQAEIKYIASGTPFCPECVETKLERSLWFNKDSSIRTESNGTSDNYEYVLTCDTCKSVYREARV